MMNTDSFDNDLDEEFASIQTGISGFEGNEPDYPMHEYMALSWQNLSAVKCLKKDEHLNVICSLLSFSIELSLKAFLHKKNIQSNELASKYGHSVTSLVEESKNYGLDLEKEDNDGMLRLFFADFDADKIERESLSNMSLEHKEYLKSIYNGDRLIELFEEKKLPYEQLLLLAYIWDHEDAKKEIDLKKYNKIRKPKSKIIEFRYSMNFISPNINKAIKFAEKIYEIVQDKIK